MSITFLVLSINSDGNVKSINKNQNLKSADCEALPPDSIMIDTATIDTISVIEIYEFGDSAIISTSGLDTILFIIQNLLLIILMRDLQEFSILELRTL